MSAASERFTHGDLFDSIIEGQSGAYALLYRPETDPLHVEFMSGTVIHMDRLEDIQACRGSEDCAQAHNDVLAIIPYRQITERGFECVDDHAPLSIMRIGKSGHIQKSLFIDRIVDTEIGLDGGEYDRNDDEYAKIASRIIQDEIGTGSGANFVLKRSYITSISDYSRAKVLALYRRLLLQSAGAYWVFLVDTGERVLIGATPERHVSLRYGIATMNPISGTYLYGGGGPALEPVLNFLSDKKEQEELFMVVDEELKMMGRICGTGATLRGPYLKPMAKLAHTEYFISGSTTLPPWKILRETLFAPTITGSPLENACRVIKKYEPEGRGYYSGVIALLGRDHIGDEVMDSSIIIRTADIDNQGKLRISAGSTLVRSSIPQLEAAETSAKAAGMLSALGILKAPSGPLALSDKAADLLSIAKDSKVVDALASRNKGISQFWQASSVERYNPHPALNGRKVLVLDAEDTFTAMICHLLGSFGLCVTVVDTNTNFTAREYDLIVLGPGPGNPNDLNDIRIAKLHHILSELIPGQIPFLAICLSHQILCRIADLQVKKKPNPNQGIQKQINLFGKNESVGFYNAYSATCTTSSLKLHRNIQAHLSRDPLTNEVHAIQSPKFQSFQFHPESILTLHGERILGDAVLALLSY